MIGAFLPDKVLSDAMNLAFFAAITILSSFPDVIIRGPQSACSAVKRTDDMP